MRTVIKRRIPDIRSSGWRARRLAEQAVNESYDHIFNKVKMDSDPACDPCEMILTILDLEIERKRRTIRRAAKVRIGAVEDRQDGGYEREQKSTDRRSETNG